MSLKFTCTNESITVVSAGKTYTVKKGAPQFLLLRKALLEENWDEVPQYLTTAKSIAAWAKGKFSVENNQIFFNKEPLAQELNQRILAMVSTGEDPTPLFKFWERLQQNPSKRSVDQLWSFLQHQGIPLTPRGTFLAYKGVRTDYKDQHSGTFDNSPGQTHRMPRNQISDDPREACHEGFHVGALAYARNFAARVVVCEVAPEHVVCVPYDHNAQKMRVCEYTVIGHHDGNELPSTSFEEEVEDTPLKEALVVEKTAQTPKAKKDAKKKVKKAGKALAKTWEKLDAMDGSALMTCSLAVLRDYACKRLKLIGASKLPGGKSSLVTEITKLQRNLAESAPASSRKKK